MFANVLIDRVGLHNHYFILMDQLEQDVTGHHGRLIASTKNQGNAARGFDTLSLSSVQGPLHAQHTCG